MKYLLELPEGACCHYHLVQSVRAKYIRILVSLEGDVKVVVPEKVQDQRAHDFVVQRAGWINKCLKEIAKTPVPKREAPTQVVLDLLDECWHVKYEETDVDAVTLISDGQNNLLIQGRLDDDLIFNVLEQWLKSRAKAVFPEILESLSKQYQLAYNRVTIRGQKTRWGSCSAKRNISLNYKLLFFPKEVVRYVFIHELCHTKEMNHSKNFWKLVAECDPNYQQHRQILKDPTAFIPVGL